LDLAVHFTYDLDDANCDAACKSLQDHPWTGYCDGCENDPKGCVKDDDHVQKCKDALDQINKQKDDFCVKGSSSSSHRSSSSSLSAAKGNATADMCKSAYFAGCWNTTPFNDGCCIQCNAHEGQQTCSYQPEKTATGGGKIQLNVTFMYDPDDDKCNKACDAIKGSIWSDFCGGKGSLDKNKNVKNCDDAMNSIHHQVNDVVKDWCGGSAEEIEAMTVQTV